MEKLTDKQKEGINIIKSSLETLLSIILDLLDAQKLDFRQSSMTKQNRDIKETITKALEILKAESNKIKINTNASGLIINHDSERIGQVIINLIKNNAIAIQPNSDKIKVVMYDNSDNVKNSSIGNRVGIPEEQESIQKIISNRLQTN